MTLCVALGPDLPKYQQQGMAFLQICLPDRWSFLEYTPWGAAEI